MKQSIPHVCIEKKKNRSVLAGKKIRKYNKFGFNPSDPVTVSNFICNSNRHCYPNLPTPSHPSAQNTHGRLLMMTDDGRRIPSEKGTPWKK